MTPFVGRAEVERFRSIVADRLGLRFDDGKIDFLSEILGRRLGQAGSAAGPYLDALAAGSRREELRALADDLSVSETYFFRYGDHFRAFRETVLPERLDRTAPLRILSAGCASGEEPYTLAILARELGVADRVRITGIDVSPAAIQRARRGRYSAWSLRDTPAEIFQRHFRADGREFVLDEAARNLAAFEERNLVEPDADFWRPDAYDVVFCRNVLMYFGPETMREVVARIAGSLAPGGYLFLGHAETLRGVSQDFHLRHTHEAFYYQRRDTLGPPEDRDRAAAFPSPALPDFDTGWVDAIRRASEHIESLATRPAPHAAIPSADAVGRAMELLREERFSEALGALPPADAGDVDSELLRAAILTNAGRVPEAEESCRRVLRLDEFNAGAHYLMALCREHAGDLAGARGHDETAVYLDPSFAMPHLHLGLMARRTADWAPARRELRRAVDLLAVEDPSRVLLFGGGFGREALTELCRAELRSCGGPP